MSTRREDRVVAGAKATWHSVWPWRFELTIAAIICAVWAWFYWTFRDKVIATFSTAMICLVVGVSLRKPLTRAVHVAWVKRKWAEAVILAGAADPPATTSRRKHSYSGPRVRKVIKTPLGEILEVSGRRRGGIAELEKHAGRIGEILHVREVRVEPYKEDRGKARVHIVRHDPLWAPIKAEGLDRDVTSVWDGTYIGIDEHGYRVNLKMIFSNLLIAGEPGGGKSVSLRPFLADAARDPNCDLWLMDGKQIELSTWIPVARGFAGPDGKAAIKLLRRLQQEMNRRYDHLLAEDLDKIPNDPAFRPHVLVCDEIAWYLNLTDGRDSLVIADLLTDLVQRGRAAGIILILATQKPAAETIPTAIRDLISYRLVFRCNGTTASNMALGGLWASEGFNAADIPKEAPGVGFLRAEGDRPIKIRVPNMTRQQAKELVNRLATKTLDDELATMTTYEASLIPPTSHSYPEASPLDAAVGARATETRQRLLAALANGPLTRTQLEPLMREPQPAWRPTLEALVREGALTRYTRQPGKARRGNPYVYELPLAGSDRYVHGTPTTE